MNVILKNFRQNAADHPHLKPNLVYAGLYDASDESLIISATVEYIVNAILTRGYRLIRVKGSEVKQ